jgi:hypothetical protein
MYSYYDKELKFDEDTWVVSLINTKKGVSSIWGGHAKIVVEGLKKNSTLYPELFVGEYHIMEAELVPQQTWIPQALRNTQCKYLVLALEKKEYGRTAEDCAEIQSRSCGGMGAKEVMKMIKNIKEEKKSIDHGEISPDFQYAGISCVYGLNGAHNCTTWAEAKLDIIGIGKHFMMDSTKAAPFIHVNSGNGSSGCALF